MVVITISDIISLIVIALAIIIFISYLIHNFINKCFKKNCYNCKYWKLRDTGCGSCWYKCEKNNLIFNQNINDDENFVKCKDFERKEN